MLISLLLLVSLANAEDFKQLQQGQPAPFAGTLLRPEAMATIIVKNDADIAECKAQGHHDLEKQEIKCELETQKIEYDFSSYKIMTQSLIEEKDKELDKTYDLLKKQTKNQTPLWLGVGFAAGFATSLGAIYVFNNI